MLTVILIWLYVIITTYLIGYGFLMVLVNRPSMANFKARKGTKYYDFKFRESYIVAGVVIVTVYAQILSLFTKVALGANVGLICVCLLVAVYYREEILVDAVEHIRTLLGGRNFTLYLAVFLIMAYGTSHGFMHYDSDLYHAQAIRWIEEYGVVKGLGNLHVRFAYNSAAFPVSALYSFRFLGGQSYHVMSGFFALLLAWQCVDIKNLFRRGHLVISDFARLVAIYYLFNIFDEMVSPASDYFLSTIVFYIIICVLDMYVRHEHSYVPYILLALLGVFAITIKLSAAPMILLTIIPIVKLFSGRTKEKMHAFWIAVALGFLIALPFLIRNVVISGWLLYPVTFLDLFNFKWEIPKGIAQYDAIEIKTFGRGYNDVANYKDVSFGEWVPHWFESIGGINKIMLILAIVSVVVYFAYLVYFIVAASGKKEQGRADKVFDITKRSMLDTADFLTIGGALTGCLLFWFFSAPLIRYGVVYVWLTVAVVLGRMIIILMNRMNKGIRNIIVRVVAVLVVFFLSYKTGYIIIDDAARFDATYLVKQQDYGRYETAQFTLGLDTYYYPADGDQIGYYPFPAATHDVTGEVELMGKEIKSGYMSISSGN